MPKVTQGYLDRQRTRILDAARACFARRGFHATSMDEIIAEAGMSSSTVYRYFPEGKQSLIRAVIDGWVDPVLEQIATLRRLPAQEAPPLEEVFANIVRRAWMLKGLEGEAGGDKELHGRRRGPDAMRTSLLLDIWAEHARDPDLHDVAVATYRHLRRELTDLVRHWQQEGRVTGRIEAEGIAVILHSAALGLITEQAVVGDARIEDAAQAVGGLLAPDRP